MKGEKDLIARALADAKLADKDVEKLRAKLPGYEQRIKQALKAGNREAAKKYALDYEQLKLDVKAAEKKAKILRAHYEQTKTKTKEIKTKLKQSETVGKLAKSMEGIAKSLDVLKEGEDMIRKIEEEAALNEARLEIALEGHDVDLEPPPSRAEEILREFEKDS